MQNIDNISRAAKLKANYWRSFEQAEKHYDRSTAENEVIKRIEIAAFHNILAEYYRPGEKILDLGCGPGLTSLFLAEHSCSVVAIDYSLGMLKKVTKMRGTRPIETRQGNAFKIPAVDGEFNGCVSRQFIDHFPEWRRILAEKVRVVKSGGYIIYTFCNADNYYTAKDIGDLGTHFGRPENVNGLYQRSVVTPEELQTTCENLDLEVIKVIPIGILNRNPLICALVGEKNYADVFNTIQSFMNSEDVMNFIVWFEKEVVSRMPLFMTYHNITILRKK